MRKFIVLGAALAALAFRPAPADPPRPANPFAQDPLGPISDVSDNWQHYQPAEEFCIKTDVFTFPPDEDATATADDPVCQFSGFKNGETGLYKFTLKNLLDRDGNRRSVLPLCGPCRRLFIDFSKIPDLNDPPYYYARGHAYFRFQSYNFTYTADPYAHSPNMKNFTNDKLFVPEDSYQKFFVEPFDLHAMSYVSDTEHFAHATQQGPWYIGKWYVNESGERINGVYLDVILTNANRFGGTGVDEIWYQAGFNDGEPGCPDNVLFGGQHKDGNYYYGGCVNHMGGSTSGVDPWR